MSIKAIKSKRIEGGEMRIYRMSNSSGAYVDLLNYGARITAVVVPDRDGRLENITLGYEGIEDYLKDSYYTGATIGRLANRIRGASFEMDNKTYSLDRNDGENCNHGGFNGLDRKLFDCEVSTNQVMFTTFSTHSEGGFPGNITVGVGYSFSNDNELYIQYFAQTDRKTPLSFTNHAYFNLAAGRCNIFKHGLRINSAMYLETDDRFIPTGVIRQVENTRFDFQSGGIIGERIKIEDDGFAGFNTYYPCMPEIVATTIYEESRGRTLEVESSMPGVLIYTGDYLAEPFVPYGGLCIEAQDYPDWINNSVFPGKPLAAGDRKEEYIIYRFGVF